jgi:YVTN family beta-propeller protein
VKAFAPEQSLDIVFPGTLKLRASRGHDIRRMLNPPPMFEGLSPRSWKKPRLAVQKMHHVMSINYSTFPVKGTKMRRLGWALVCGLLVASSTILWAQDDTGSYQRVRKIPIGGDGGWDYVTADPASSRLYISRGNRIVVLDTASDKVVGELPETKGVHGVALASALGRGFTSNGGDDSVTIFDLKTLKPISNVKVGGRPDAIHFDPESERVFTFNHGSNDATAIDASAGTVVGTVPLQGVPEAAVSDGRGHVFVNLMDKNEIVEFDARSLGILNRWSLAPGVRPTGLALDRKTRRLFSVCGNQKMIVMNADKGDVVATLDIGQGADGCVFDADRALAFSSNGRDGTLTIVRETGPDTFTVAGTVPTQRGARTIALDSKTHRLYLPTAQFAAAPAAADQPKSPDQPKTKGRRPNLVPGSFTIVVVGD